ncbi:MAG: response regulator [Kofleriaceae bacterium]
MPTTVRRRSQRRVALAGILIFLDVVMPVMDGPTALKEIRARGVMTPVVLVTSISTASVVATAVKLGKVQYIGKPFTPEMIRAVAVKMLGLVEQPARVLLQHHDPDLPKQFAKALPAHVQIDATSSLSESIDLAVARRHQLVIFEPQNLADEAEAVAGVLRDILPAAGIFAIDESSTSLWHPDGPLDGVLPKPFDLTLGRSFLYPTFLRPVVDFKDRQARVLGRQGAHPEGYLATVERALVHFDHPEPEIDLLDLDADPATISALVSRLHRDLTAAGAAPAFRAACSLADTRVLVL